jgi:hypothetical protein
MRSSTSGSEPAAADRVQRERYDSVGRRRVIVILGTLLFCLVGIEAGARFAFARISRIERRVMTEHVAAQQLRRSSSVSPVLLAGDSLLLLDLDLNVLPHKLPAGVHLQRFSIEQTAYLDWLFGLRRLFSEGARPAVVILCIAPNSLVSSTIQGDYSAFYLYKVDDIPAIAKRAGYDLTKESSLLFAHYSLFFAGRSNLRNFILSRVFPAYAGALHNLLTHPPAPMPREEVLSISQPRFQELKRLCGSYGAHFVYVVAPGFGIQEGAIVEAGSRAGVPVVVPVHSDAWPPSKFSDGFHLNEAAAREFTEKLSPALDSLLASYDFAAK